TSPRAMPMKIEHAIAAMITSSAVCAPQITRESTSKPDTVVPSRLMSFGACLVPNEMPSAVCCCAHEYGASRGAATATTTKRTVITRPVISIPRCRPTLCRSCEMTGIRSVQCRLRTGAAASASVFGVGMSSGDDGVRVISVPHPRVDERGDDVDDEVRDGHDDGDHDDDPLHGDEVARLQVLGEHEAQALPFEGGLGQHGPGEQHRQLHAHDGDDRDERRAVGVLGHQAVLAHTAGATRGDVLLTERADDVG